MVESTKAPIDPRLLKQAKSIRTFLVQGGLISFVNTLLTIAFSWLIADLIVSAISGESLVQLGGKIAIFALVLVARFGLSWLTEVLARQGSAKVKTQLRSELFSAFQKLGGTGLAKFNRAELVTVAGRGLDSLDQYFAKFLPQLIATAISTPILVFVLFTQDIFTGIVVIVALPLIPIFMALIGWVTESVQKKQWNSLSQLAKSFLELVEGLSTLKIFSRQYHQLARLEQITDDYRKKTMKVLRVSFVSSFVLELAASLSVALVAVSIGIRLIEGEIPLSLGLFVLLLAPEAFLPIRQVGSQFHASAEGVAAVDEVFRVIEIASANSESAKTNSTSNVEPELNLATAQSGLKIKQLSFSYFSDSSQPRLIQNFELELLPGQVKYLVGKSGSGKSSIFQALLSFLPYEGQISYAGNPLTADQISWSPQDPQLAAGTVEENIVLAAENTNYSALNQACELAALDQKLLAKELLISGSGISGGQQQRLSLARCYYRALTKSTPLILLDEPSSALDNDTEKEVASGIARLAELGFAVLVITHRESLIPSGSETIRIGSNQAEEAKH